MYELLKNPRKCVLVKVCHCCSLWTELRDSRAGRSRGTRTRLKRTARAPPPSRSPSVWRPRGRRRRRGRWERRVETTWTLSSGPAGRRREETPTRHNRNHNRPAEERGRGQLAHIYISYHDNTDKLTISNIHDLKLRRIFYHPFLLGMRSREQIHNLNDIIAFS